MAHLLKPDMRAVLSRTHLASTFASFMLPIYEAGSNSIHSLLDKLGHEKVAASGRLSISISLGAAADEFSVTISDNGDGLDSRNFQEFRTPFTGHKLRRGGKGFGRFIAFKVFNDVEYETRYVDPDGSIGYRKFRFDIDSDEEISDLSGSISIEYDTGCAVTYRQVKAPYQYQWTQLNDENILDSLSSNFLPYLVDGRMPNTTIEIGEKEYDLREHFSRVFTLEQSHTFELNLRDKVETFKCDVSRVQRGKPFSSHALLFFADNRLVGSGRAIENKLGRTAFQRSDGTEYVVIASLSGEFLDANANQPRTSLDATEEELAEIVDHVSRAILQTESEQNDKIKDAQRDDVVQLLSRHPLLRYGLNTTVADYVRAKPNSWKIENFVSDLAVQRLREERRWTSYVQKTIADPALFQQRKDQLLRRVSDTYRDALAEYIVHRRAVIEVADHLRGADDTGKMTREDAFHQLMFPRLEDSVSTKYFQHNLWLLDERLAFVSYISSDRTLHGGRRSSGDKIADIAFYDECFVAGGEGNSSVVIVEFKRPGRDDYLFGRDGSDPIKQIYDTVAHIRDRKSFITTDKKTIEIPASTPITSVIVADLEPTLRDLATRYDFDEAWDRKGYFRYHDKYDAFVEILGFNKLISDAEKRNAAFFDILLGDLGA